MSLRTLKLKVLDRTELVKVETAARTFGELKAEEVVKGLGIDWSSAKLIDRASKAEFVLDEAVLPATDAVMFVMPTKSKAGADLPYKEVKELVKNFKANGGVVPFNYTQASAEQLNKFWKTVEESKNVAEDIASELESVEEEENVIFLTPGKYTIIVEDGYEDVEEVNLLDETTLEDLDVEAQQLKARQ